MTFRISFFLKKRNFCFVVETIGSYMHGKSRGYCLSAPDNQYRVKWFTSSHRAGMKLMLSFRLMIHYQVLVQHSCTMLLQRLWFT